jgi:hypothetical protein
MNQKDRAVSLVIAEISECVRDLAFAQLMPESNARTAKIAGCYAGIKRAANRLEVQDKILEDDARKGKALRELISAFLLKHEIAVPEDLYQLDTVFEAYPAFADSLVEVVGFPNAKATTNAP